MGETLSLGHPLPTALEAPITSSFGTRVHPLTGLRSGHFGTDFGAPSGTPVGALADGEVVFVGRQVVTRPDGSTGGAGNYVILRHGEGLSGAVYSAAFHLRDGSTQVAAGDRVGQGAIIAEVGSTGGSTGPHLHLEVFEGGNEAVIRAGGIGSSGARRLDPEAFLGRPTFDGMTIREGDRNGAVDALQRDLVDRGLLPPEGVDGIFGRITRGAVEALQRQLGVEDDGIVGRDTFAALAAERDTPDPTPDPPPPGPGLDTAGPFATTSVGALVGVRGGTPLGALDAAQSYALGRAVFGDGPGAAALEALDRHYGPGDGTLVQREIALALHEGGLHVGRENADPASGYNLGTFQIGGARSTPDVTRARYDGLVGDGVVLYEGLSGTTVALESLTVADRDVFAHLGHIVEKGRISATSTPDRHFERLADPSLQGDALARFMSREIQVGVAAIGQAVVRFTDPDRGVGIDLEAVTAREAEPDATRGEPAMPVVRQRFAPDASPAVEAWQEVLREAGYDLGPTGADGRFGPATDAATRQAQRDAGLTPDGIVGGDTWAAYADVGARVVDGTAPATPDPVSVRFLEQLDAHAANLLDRYTDDPERAVTALNEAARPDGIDRPGAEAVLRATDPAARTLSDVDADALTRALTTRATHAAESPAAAAEVDAQRETLADRPDPASPAPDEALFRGDGAVRETEAPVPSL